MSRWITAPDAAMCGVIAIVGVISIALGLFSSSGDCWWGMKVAMVGLFGYFLNR